MVESQANARRRENRMPQAGANSAARTNVAGATAPAEPPIEQTSVARTARPQGHKSDGAKRASGLATAVFSAAVLASLSAAWWVSEEEYIIAGSGTGYWLGIAGSLMMLVLALYPLRKKHARSQRYGRIATWFKSHMVLGILGPSLVILHSNFVFKSVNAIVATVAMLTVVASGIVGRFLYSRVHKGLYGAKADAKALMSDAAYFGQAFGENAEGQIAAMSELKIYEREILDSSAGLLQSLKTMVDLGRKTRQRRKAHWSELQAMLSATALREHWDDAAYQAELQKARLHLDLYYATVRKAAGLKVYDRLLGWWHVLHLPLFILLILTAIAHVVAVHLY